MLMSEALQGKPVSEQKESDKNAGPVTLNALLVEDTELEKKIVCPTPDLIALKKGVDLVLPKTEVGGYYIWCEDTKEMWYAPNRNVLDMNFIYREDLVIHVVDDIKAAEDWVTATLCDLAPGEVTRKACYILDMPSIEKYEVFYDPSYPARKYGTCSPRGTCVTKCANRFERDAAIVQLDKKYTEASAAATRTFVNKGLSANQAIVVSDGALIKGNVASSIVYIDKDKIIRQSISGIPSDENQGVIIAEVSGAHEALSMCYRRQKRDITYYYDNTAIVNILSNNRYGDIPEIRRYRKLCADMNENGYRVNFVEIHPKRGEHTDDNKALLYLHNMCDADCSMLAELFHRDYPSHAATGRKDGKSYKQITRKNKGK